MEKIIIDNINTPFFEKLNLRGREADLYLNKEDCKLYKIYKPLPYRKKDVIYFTNLREKKVKALSEKNELANKMVLPSDCVYNSNDEFIGYTMPYYSDAVNLEQYFQNHYDYIDTLYRSFLQISKDYQFFHNHNVYVPDFNFRNVLLVGDQLIFCDGDSAKIGSLPATTNSSLMISHYHTMNKKIVESANFDKELLIASILKDVYHLNVAMLKPEEFYKKLSSLEKKYNFTSEELRQFHMLKEKNGNFLYPHEFLQPEPAKKKKKSFFLFR